MSSSSAYRYTSLTAAISDKTSPLRQYLDARFPNRAPLQSAYRAAAGALRVPGGDANAGTLGAAFDFPVRAVLDETTSPGVALAAFKDPDEITAIHGVMDAARRNPAGRSDVAPEPLLRAVWALALCTEVFRAGLMPGSPLLEARRRNEFTTEGLLQLAPPNALEQLQQLHEVATVALYPSLPDTDVAYVMGPTFDASALCAADADFIVDGQLIELKVRLGPLNARGQRADVLALRDIYQVLTYVLFDRSNQYGIDRIGFYSARYGQLATWPLNDYMTVLSGRTLNLEEERAAVWELLGGKPGKPSSRVDRNLSPVAAKDPDDYYVDVLEAADAWCELVDQDDDPTIEEWGLVVDALGDAVEAVREFEATAGTAVRDEPWGGTRAKVVAVVDAAEAWYDSNVNDDLAEAELDAVYDRLGEAVHALRSAEGR